MNRVAVTVAFAAIAAVSFAIGRATAPSVAPPIPKRAATIVRASEDRRHASDDEALEQCETKLALAQGVLEAQEREKLGDPVPFPVDLQSKYGPEGFETVVREAMRACPDTGLQLERVDCAEFPCMAFFTQARGAMNHGMDKLRSCGVWTESFGRWGGQANDSFMTDAGVAEFSMASVAPLDAASDENSHLRWTQRLEEGKAELMAAMGGREFTPLEQLDQQLAFMREYVDDEEMIAALERKRDKLAAEQDAEP